MSVVSIALALLWMRMLLSFAEDMIRVALWTNVGLLVVFGFTTMAVNPFLPFFCFAAAAINVWYIFSVQDRIAFATANLKIACKAVETHRSIIGVALLLLLKQLIWISLWTIAAVGIYQMFRDGDDKCAQLEKQGQLCGGTPASVAFFFLILSLAWGQQVIQNLLTCTTAGTVASWWYQQNPQAVVSGSFYRASTTSFGSICFGSLLVAIIQAMRTMAQMLEHKSREESRGGLACVACLLNCILGCLQDVMEYINKWAFCYVGIYGFDFQSSGKAVMHLFKTRGWTAVINDDLTSSALGFGALGVGFVSCGIGLLIAKLAPSEWFAILPNSTVKFASFGGISFVIGFAMAIVISTVVTTALHTIFVCFAEDPNAFQQTHPDHYSQLVYAWKQFHPDVMISAYGSNV